MRLSDRDCKTAWKAFFRDHCDELFQLSLLLTADPDNAAETLATTLDNIDISVPPRTEDLALLQKTMAIKIVRDPGDICTPRVSNASSMLQSGLRPILQLERFPRACFVLRFLLGYGVSSCAQMMRVEEAAIKALLQMGLIQFHRAVLESRRDCDSSTRGLGQGPPAKPANEVTTDSRAAASACEPYRELIEQGLTAQPQCRVDLAGTGRSTWLRRFV